MSSPEEGRVEQLSIALWDPIQALRVGSLEQFGFESFQSLPDAVSQLMSSCWLAISGERIIHLSAFDDGPSFIVHVATEDALYSASVEISKFGSKVPVPVTRRTWRAVERVEVSAKLGAYPSGSGSSPSWPGGMTLVVGFEGDVQVQLPAEEHPERGRSDGLVELLGVIKQATS